jgi:predicted RND superfamily exporter protein
VSYGRERNDPDDEELGSLTQGARRTSLKQARTILIVIGVITVLMNFVFLLGVEKEAKDVITAEKQKAGPGMQFDEAKLKEAEETIVRIARLIYAGTIALGVVFIILGVAVYKAPVACTVTGLVLYVAGIAIFAAIEPMSLVQGILFKIIFTIGLVKAVQAALAYEREVKAERESRSRRDEFESGGREEPLNF